MRDEPLGAVALSEVIAERRERGDLQAPDLRQLLQRQLLEQVEQIFVHAAFFGDQRAHAEELWFGHPTAGMVPGAAVRMLDLVVLDGQLSYRRVLCPDLEAFRNAAAVHQALRIWRRKECG